MAGHRLSDFKLSAVLQVGSDASSSKTVRVDLGSNAVGHCAALNHFVNVSLGQGSPSASVFHVEELGTAERRARRPGLTTVTTQSSAVSSLGARACGSS